MNQHKSAAGGTLDGKVIVVVGAAGAQGRVAAELLRSHGACLVLADAMPEGVEKLKAELSGDDVIARSLDASSENDWDALIRQAVSSFGGLHGLANFAAILSRPGVEETELDAWNRTLEVNLTGAWLGMRAVIPEMRRAGGGSIVNIGSVDALVGRGGGAAYQASKGGLRILSKSAATQYAAEGIRVNCVHPGPMQVRMTQIVGPRADAKATASLEARLTAQVPIGRLGQASDIAHAARYLLSDEASFVTGIDLPVDGGLTAQ